MGIIKGAEPFLLPAGDKGVLLIHGFTGAPSEMRLMGDYLHNQGYTVLGVRLAGHGTTVEELAQTRWVHWYSSVENGYHILKGLCKEISVVGLSMGGLLALNLAAEYPVAHAVSLSTPIYLFDKRMPLLPVYKYFRSYVPKTRREYDADKTYSISYDRTPLESLDSLMKNIKLVSQLLPKVNMPVLVMQSKKEHTVRPESAEYIYQHLGSNNKKLVFLEKSGHIITLDTERQFVFENILAFFRGE